MKIRTTRWAIRMTVMAVAMAAVTLPVDAAESPFTYQGQLKQDGVPVTGSADFEFRLWDAETGGTELANDFLGGVSLNNGLFTVQVAFDAGLFNGLPRWLEIHVAYPSGGAFTPMTGRQAISPVPYATTAISTVGVDGHSLDAQDGIPADAVRVDYSGKVLMEKGGLTVFDQAGHGIILTSDRFVFNEGTSEDPVYDYSSSTDTHEFYTNGTRQMIISAAGNVGLGMTWSQIPSAKLHIGGTAGVDGIMFPDGTLQTSAATGSGSSLWSESGSDVYYDAGNVGVGTTTPSHALHVVSDGERAISGENNAASGVAHGVYGESGGTGGRGVSGEATASTGATYGVLGRSYSTGGRGVYGNASASSGFTHGVSGQSWSSTGRGVNGLASATSGVNYGVYGETASPDGFAGYFVGPKNYFQGNVGIGQQNPAAKLHIGGTAGIDGLMFPDGTLQTTASAGGGSSLWTLDQPGRISYDGEVTIGTDNTTASLKVFTEEGPAITALVAGEVGDGIVVSTVGIGTRALAATASGEESYALDATATNTDGIAVYAVARGSYGTGIHATSSGANGVTIKANARTDTQVAIEANATGTATLNGYPLPNTAGTFFASGAGSVGVYGHVDEGKYGVHGRSDYVNGSGVFGEATGSGDATGVYGKTESTRGRGVYGYAEATSGITRGVYGKTVSPDGIGVAGLASATTGTAVGVVGQTNSSDGYAGKFFGGRSYFEGNVGIGEDNPLTTLHLGGESGVDGLIFPDGSKQVTAAVGGGGDSLWSNFFSMIYYTAGKVGIGTSIPAERLHVVGDTRLEGKVTIGDTLVGGADLGLVSSNIYGVKANLTTYLGAAIAGEATYTGTNGVAHGVTGVTATPGGSGVYGSGNHAGVEGVTDTVGGAGVYGHHIGATASYGVRGESASTSGYGGYFTNTSPDGTALYAASAGAGTGDATLQVHNTQPNAGMAAYITSVGSYATMHAKNNGTGEVLWLSRDNTDGEFIVAQNEHTGGRVFAVYQDGWTQVSVLEITGGADLSEQFDVASDGADVEPGMVVAIDAENPGKLVVANRPYDYTVAGVVSGAGGVKPGMLMGQKGSIADGKHPVALTGRVWTWCDASGGAIKPGDLLTTSSVLGHAMKVTDRTKAQGAMIGKAMTSLSEGKGLVLVLVSLQ